MLKRFYADNFRCLINFELKLDAANVFLGVNGTGKTSVLTVLRKLQHLIVRGGRSDDVFPTRDLTLGQSRKEQRFELETSVDEHTFAYGLTVDQDPATKRMRIIEETLEHDGRPIFEFQNGSAQFYDDAYEKGPKYPSDWNLSGVGALNERPDNKKLTKFKNDIGNYIIVGICPPLIRAETREEDEFLDPLMENFVGWYRHYSQENMGSVGRLFDSLRVSLPNFDSIRLRESGENSRALKAVFRSTSKNPVEYGLHQLSDGQRALIALYSLIVLTDDRRVSLFIDEPDNYVALREIQPWLSRAIEGEDSDTRLEQIVVVSHHPITLDYMAGAHGRWFFRDGDGPVRVTEEAKVASGGLKVSDILARGWEQ